MIGMILFLELSHPRRMRFESRLDSSVLPELNDFVGKFAASRGWDSAMKDRLSAVAEETLLTLAPLDLSLDLDAEEEDEADEEGGRRLIVLAASEGPVAEMEFIGGDSEEGNLEDRIRQLQQHDEETPMENEISLRLLRRYASSVRHQQFHGTDIITVSVSPPGTR